MIYSTELANKVTVAGNNNKYLEAGIHDNVKFTGVRTAASPTGINFIEFRFEKDGKELLHTEWEPSARQGDSEEQNQSKVTNQVTRIIRIMNCFYPKSVLTFNGSSYKEFTDWVVAMLNNANKDTLLKLKVVYNSKGYTTLPSYVRFAFIEPMVLPEGFYDKTVNPDNKSMISELSIDQFTKPVIADKETKVDDLASTVTTEESSDLPF